MYRAFVLYNTIYITVNVQGPALNEIGNQLAFICIMIYGMD